MFTEHPLDVGTTPGPRDTEGGLWTWLALVYMLQPPQAPAAGIALWLG